MTHDLKKCPFCGSTELRVQTDYTQTSNVKCGGCDADGPPRNSEADAVEWWNNREEVTE